MDNQMDFFFERKKLKLLQMKRDKKVALLQARRDAWAQKLQPMHSMPNCCLKKCVSGAIPVQLLLQKRKVLHFCMHHLFSTTAFARSTVTPQ